MADEIKAPTYSIDLKIGNQAARRYVIKGRTTIGKSEECDINVDGTGMAPLHLALMDQGGILGLIHLAKSYSIVLDQQELEYGRSYILDRGDKLKIAEVEIVIRKDEVLTILKKEAPQDEESEEDTPEVKTQKISLDSLMKQAKTGTFTSEKLKSPTLAQEVPTEEEQQGVDEEISEETEEESEDGQKQSGIKEKILAFKNSFSNLLKKKNTPKSDGHTKTISKITIKKSALPFSVSPPPTVAPRFYSLLLDFAFVYGIKYFVIPFFDLGTAIDNFLPSLLALLDKTQTAFFAFLSEQFKSNNFPLEIPAHFNLFIKENFLTPQVVLPCVLFVIIQLTFHLLAGNSLGLYLMGAKSNDSLGQSRLKALAKCLIGFITFPFIVFDLPILFNKRSFKEFITFSDVEMKSRIQSLISGILIIPLLIIAALISPIFLSLEDINGPTLAQNEIQYKKLKADEIPQINLALTDGQILINGILIKQKTQQAQGHAPFILSTREQEQVHLEIYDFSKKSLFKISFDNKIKIRPLIPLLSEGNPLFSYLFSKANYLTEDNTTVANIESQTEIMEVIKSSFLLGEDSLIPHILENGPFINGLVKFRRELYKILEMQRPSDLELVKIQGQDYLSVTKNENGPYTKIFFLNLDFSQNEQLNYIFSFKKENFMMGAAMAKHFLQSLKKLSNKDLEQQRSNDLQKDFLLQKAFYTETQRKGKNNTPEIFFHEEDLAWWTNYLLHNSKISAESSDQALISAQNSNLKNIANSISHYKKFWESAPHSQEIDLTLFSQQMQRINFLEHKISEIGTALKAKNMEYFSMPATAPQEKAATP